MEIDSKSKIQPSPSVITSGPLSAGPELTPEPASKLTPQPPPEPPAQVAPDDKKNYPGVELAYDIAVASYDSIIKRLDVMDGRIQSLLAFAATTTAVVPTVANARGLSFASWWLYVSLGLFGVQLAAGIVGRSLGTIRLLKPETFYKQWLHKSEWLFKKDLIYWAAKDFEENAALLNVRWWTTVILSALFFIEVLFLLGWIAFAPVTPKVA